jgi:hypothetical protein
MQLRFTSFAVTSLWRDLHPQERPRAGRTKQKAQSEKLGFLRKFFGVADGLEPTTTGITILGIKLRVTWVCNPFSGRILPKRPLIYNAFSRFVPALLPIV